MPCQICQNSSTLRRLASDHSSLHKSELPPYYLFPLANGSSSVPDDLTQLTILLTGPQGTPYAQGLWKLWLKIPEDYPKSPPKAAFRTRIWHPNVEENTGNVCVDTLKKDWDSKLTLRDVLIVSTDCFLIFIDKWHVLMQISWPDNILPPHPSKSRFRS